MQHRPEQHFLEFTRKEKQGILVLLFVILVLKLTPEVYSRLAPDEVTSDTAFLNDIARLKIISEDSAASKAKRYATNSSSYTKTDVHSDETRPSTLFDFDPNTLSTDGWVKLGASDRLARTIRNYTSKGARFKEPADIKKIWGMPASLADRLIPFVRIVSDPPQAKRDTHPRFQPYQRKPVAPVELNNADSAGLDALPGIGGGYARRIISFRERLGGFISVDQVAETFGLPDSVFQKIRPFLKINAHDIRKINLNEATLDELKSHPYIRFRLANAIYQYRVQHGPFADIADLKKIMIITEEIYEKIRPYVTL